MATKTVRTEPVRFQAACAIESDYVFVAAKPESLDEDQAFTRIFYFDQQNATPWRHVDIPDFTVAGVCVAQHALGRVRSYVSISNNGVLHIANPQGIRQERIAEAGLERSEPPIYGYINALREIGEQLYACGGGGQIYRRDAGSWVSIAGDLRQPVAAPAANLALNPVVLADDFSDIDGTAAGDLYVVGDGTVHHYDGTTWSPCVVNTDESLTRVRCVDSALVWVCGFNGTLLRGNADSGFVDVSQYDLNVIFHDLCVFRDQPYLASNDGLFRYDGQRVVPVPLQFADGDTAVCAVDVRDGVLWCFGYRSLATFDGDTWQHIRHPDNV